MEESRSELSKILKYQRRRFDGGSEMELIQAMEAGQVLALKTIGPLTTESTKVMDIVEDTPDLAPPPAVPEQKASGKLREIGYALLLGPVEILVGLVGLFTCTVAIGMFTHFKNQSLVTKSQTVLKDCLKTLVKGCKDTVLAPAKVTRLALA